MMPPLPVLEPRSRRPLAAAAAAAAIAAALYLPHVGAGFASEDFLILARLHGQDLATTARQELTGAWLGLESVAFWRPVSTLLLALELRVLGLEPARLHLFHLLLHVLNACLVATIVVRVLRPRGPAVAAAVVSALYVIHPFHPSAVLFTGAFATLYGASFSLVSLLYFLTSAIGTEPRGRRRLGPELCALGSFALALGSYEASAVLPAVLLVITFLQPEALGAARRVVPYFVVLAAWLAARGLILGNAVGGYADLRARFLTAPLERAADLARSVRGLLHPAFDVQAGLPGALVALVVATLLGAAATAIARPARAPTSSRPARPTTAGRGALAGLAWTALFLAPFAFVGIVPANGRYAYLAVAGLLLTLAGLASALVARWPRVGAAVAAIALTVVAADWTWLLRSYLAANDAASAQVAQVRAEALHVAAALAPDTLLLIEGHPDFVKSAAGVPIAKVLQYGLAESLRPPFGSLERSVLPLPASVTDETRLALGAMPGVARYRWDAASSSLRSVAPAPAPRPNLEILAIDRSSGLLEASCDTCASARLVVLAAVMPFVAAPISIGEGRARFAAPAAFLRGIARHRREPAWFWVEERSDAGPTALSPIGRVSLDGDPVAGFAEAAAKIRGDRETDDAR